MNMKEPEIIIVKIGDREFRTAIDSHGTQRFLPHDEVNPELSETMREFREYMESGKLLRGVLFHGYGPSEMYRGVASGQWTLDEVLSYETANGWSVKGFADISIFDELTIENPLWAGREVESEEDYLARCVTDEKRENEEWEAANNGSLEDEYGGEEEDEDEIDFDDEPGVKEDPDFEPEEGIIIVSVGKRKFRTALDDRGIQRFLPHDRGNPKLKKLMKKWDKYIKGNTSGRWNGDYDPNRMNIDYHNGRWTRDDLLFYETGSGWSVSGFTDISTYQNLPIHNPLWENEAK